MHGLQRKYNWILWKEAKIMRTKVQFQRMSKVVSSSSSSLDLIDVNVLSEKKTKGFQPWWESWLELDCINSPHTEALLKDVSAQLQSSDSEVEE